jgi:hypothetical protein
MPENKVSPKGNKQRIKIFRPFFGASLAEHSRFHSWFNTVLACIAMVIAASSAFISWKSYSLNVESFGLTSDFTYNCPFEFGMMREFHPTDKQSHFVGLCWQVTIANQSGTRASIVDSSSAFPMEGHPPKKWIAASILDQKGHTLAAPISFDGGEARTVVVRIGVPITDALWKLIEDAIKAPDGTKPQAKDLETLTDVASMAAQAKLDTLGNPVTVSEAGPVYVIGFPSDYKKAIVNFRVQTGRGNFFETQLTYPNGPVELVPLSKAH